MIPLVGTWAFIPTKEEMIASPWRGERSRSPSISRTISILRLALTIRGSARERRNQAEEGLPRLLSPQHEVWIHLKLKKQEKMAWLGT
jgi:hypothetical protein